ncbi:MAG: hypothetical protein Q9221_003372 [Calogaya cf. arnoldii]
MHSSITYFALALSLASSAIARPQQNQNRQNGNQATTTSSDGYQVPPVTDLEEMPQITNDFTQHQVDNDYPSGGDGVKVPKQCSMFLPYVAPALMGPICSLHMTPLAPGSMPIVPTSCFSAGGSQMTLGVVNHQVENNEDQNEDEDENENENEKEDDYQAQPTLNAQKNYQQGPANYGATTTTDSTTSTRGAAGYGATIPTPSNGYGEARNGEAVEE